MNSWYMSYQVLMWLMIFVRVLYNWAANWARATEFSTVQVWSWPYQLCFWGQKVKGQGHGIIKCQKTILAHEHCRRRVCLWCESNSLAFIAISSDVAAIHELYGDYVAVFHTKTRQNYFCSIIHTIFPIVIKFAACYTEQICQKTI